MLGEIGSFEPVNRFARGEFEAERNSPGGHEAPTPPAHRRARPRLYGRRDSAIVKRRFTMAWHQRIPSPVPLDPIEPLLDLRRAAHLLGISVKTLRDWIHARKIEHVKVGARVMIRPETIRQYVTSHTRRVVA